MPAFGGADLRTLYVTSARQTNLSPHLHDGGVFAFEAPAPGLPTHPASTAYFVTTDQPVNQTTQSGPGFRAPDAGGQ